MARELRGRNKNNRREKNVILFGVEGKTNKTEKTYFNNFQNRNNPFNIQFASVTCTDPINIVKNTLRYMSINDISKENGDKIYCVFDGDYNENGKDKQLEIKEAIKIAQENGIEVILSVPSFEIWFLLHFKYTTRCFSSNDELTEYLKRFIPNYDKNMNVFSDLEGMMNNAINNSKKLKKHFNINEKDYISSNEYNPSTDVYKVIEYIRGKQNEIK